MTERKCACNKLFSIKVRGPNTENFEKKFYRQCELGCGSQHREFRNEILQAMRVGVGRRNKFCENIISVPLPNLSWIYLYLNPLLLVYESIMKAL
ncbi:conserved hypothetical protein [Staphylococcus aureus subsp. aureus M1015]|nr:hypothetical protein HMPREF0772_10474 [Staphylococcus aureus subsp. aureus TCH60]EFB45143.1 hypothetical protein SARG_00188 [Staphylococcus aureus subsp. aureus C101]EFB53327.1 conserved hypothetical protein [Staphylococcus aureus subsp. aureus M899]EFB54280.1 conserved hypothetical protein [Staphylococcus aureus subsp. aureus WBG10049]EFD96283.1 conserved hypothetical protein [Staphylococcus aureus subsp. aureus M1015]EFE27150.1 hypothetical protein SCAG_00534 [Staphylococcus aureus subsp.